MLKRFFKDSVLYITASMFTKGIGFLLLPIYLMYLDKEAYGQFDYLSSITLLLAVVICFEISQGVLRFVADANSTDSDKNNYISVSIYFTLICYFVFLVIVYLLKEKISFFLFDTQNYSYIIFLAALACFSNAFLYLVTVIFRAKLLAKRAVIFSALSALLVGIISSTLLVLYNFEVDGVFLGQIFGQFIAALFAFIYLKNNLILFPKLDYLKKLLIFSFPLIFSSLGVILSMLSDRIIIKEYLNLELLAVYAVAAKVASLVSIIIMGFQSALSPLIYSELKNDALKNRIKQIMYIYAFFVVLISVTLYVMQDFLIVFIAGGDYIKAADVLVILCLAVMVNAFSMFFPGLSIEGKTFTLSKINVLVAIFNIVLNIVAVPLYGIVGAALSTLLSAFLYVAINFYFSEKYYPLFKR